MIKKTTLLLIYATLGTLHGSDRDVATSPTTGVLIESLSLCQVAVKRVQKQLQTYFKQTEDGNKELIVTEGNFESMASKMVEQGITTLSLLANIVRIYPRKKTGIAYKRSRYFSCKVNPTDNKDLFFFSGEEEQAMYRIQEGHSEYTLLEMPYRNTALQNSLLNTLVVLSLTTNKERVLDASTSSSSKTWTLKKGEDLIEDNAQKETTAVGTNLPVTNTTPSSSKGEAQPTNVISLVMAFAVGSISALTILPKEPTQPTRPKRQPPHIDREPVEEDMQQTQEA